MDRRRGFTLLELMIATAIIAILAALATAAYGRYAFRAHRTDAHHMLMTIAHGEERWHTTYNQYTQDLSRFGYAEPATSPHGYYEVTLAVDGTAAQTYTATATPIHAQASDVCGSLSIDNKGDKQPDRSDVEANANGSCW